MKLLSSELSNIDDAPMLRTLPDRVTLRVSVTLPVAEPKSSVYDGAEVAER